jgi:hypothetical protein
MEEPHRANSAPLARSMPVTTCRPGVASTLSSCHATKPVTLRRRGASLSLRSRSTLYLMGTSGATKQRSAE